MGKPTVFDLRTIGCGCDHEKVGRNQHSTSSDVIEAVRSCRFAMSGLMLNCAHGDSSARFFSHSGRDIMAEAMKTYGMESAQLHSFYAMKGYLDVLKRRACGRSFPMDPTVAQMKKSEVLKPFLHYRHPLREIMLKIFHYADHPPRDENDIRDCDLFFLNADNFISDGIDIILKRTQDAARGSLS